MLIATITYWGCTMIIIIQWQRGGVYPAKGGRGVRVVAEGTSTIAHRNYRFYKDLRV